MASRILFPLCSKNAKLLRLHIRSYLRNHSSGPENPWKIAEKDGINSSKRKTLLKISQLFGITGGLILIYALLAEPILPGVFSSAEGTELVRIIKFWGLDNVAIDGVDYYSTRRSALELVIKQLLSSTDIKAQFGENALVSYKFFGSTNNLKEEFKSIYFERNFPQTFRPKWVAQLFIEPTNDTPTTMLYVTIGFHITIEEKREKLVPVYIRGDLFGSESKVPFFEIFSPPPHGIKYYSNFTNKFEGSYQDFLSLG